LGVRKGLCASSAELGEAAKVGNHLARLQLLSLMSLMLLLLLLWWWRA